MNYGKRSAERRIEKVDSKGTKVRKRINVIISKIILACVIIVAVFGCSAGLGIYKGIIDSSPDMTKYDVIPTGYSTTVLASDGSESATLVASGSNRKYVTIDDVPKHLQQAFIAIEDARFYTHNGIDLYGIVRVGINGIASGFHFNQGASTITQQLIKNNVLTSWTGETTRIERVQRKIQEQYLAIQLEKQVSKEWILENYMNTINLGSNCLGVQAASLRYFGKDVSELTLSESAVIAGITKNPSAYNPILHPEASKKRQKLVLDAMLEQEMISKKEYDEALADDVFSRIAEYNVNVTDNTNSYFVDALIDQVMEDLVAAGYTESEAYKLLYQGGLTIHSTQDPAMQAIADEEVSNEENYPFVKYSFFLSFQVKEKDGTINNYSHNTMLRYYQEINHNSNYNINYDSEEECMEAIAQYEAAMCENGGEVMEGSESITITLQPQLALTIIDQSNGYVKALCGGRGDKASNRTWNRATDTTRQPGSCFKIIGCYVAALDGGGKTLASVVDDAPLTVGTKEFNNYDFVHHGWTTIRQAIIMSINITTVKNLQDIGVDLAYQYANKVGITTLCEDDKNLALALGGITYGVKNVDLTAAYATIANGGTYYEPIYYTEIYDHDGNLLLDRTATQKQEKVLKDSTCFLLSDAMSQVLTSGTGTAAYFGTGMAQAGKSGTTTNDRDTVWAGYTPYYTCAVWGGFDDNAIQSGSAVAYPKVIWRKIMQRIHEGLEPKSFVAPSSVVQVQVCAESGLLPQEGVCDQDPRGSRVITEYFDVDSVPTETCNHHVKLTICNDSGKIANPYCPSSSETEKVFVVGASPETIEADVLATDEFLNQVCEIHNASTHAAQNAANENNNNNNNSNTTGNTTENTTGNTTGNTGNNTGESNGTGTTGDPNTGTSPEGGNPSGGSNGESSENGNNTPGGNLQSLIDRVTQP